MRVAGHEQTRLIPESEVSQMIKVPGEALKKVVFHNGLERCGDMLRVM